MELIEIRGHAVDEIPHVMYRIPPFPLTLDMDISEDYVKVEPIEENVTRYAYRDPKTKELKQLYIFGDKKNELSEFINFLSKQYCFHRELNRETIEREFAELKSFLYCMVIPKLKEDNRNGIDKLLDMLSGKKISQAYEDREGKIYESN